jgi:hypothetical protein
MEVLRLTYQRHNYRSESRITVKLLDKLMRRDNSEAERAKWLSEHPGKGAMPVMPPGVDAEHERLIREHMEKELEEERAKRG